jgi:DNA polymerase
MAVAGLFATMHEGAEAAQRYVELGEGSGRNIDGPAPNCWLTNAIKFRPPRNRTPTPEEMEYARDIVRREWLAVGKPDVIIAVGRTAYETITGKRDSILKVSGAPRAVRDKQSGMKLTLWPMVHPSFGLRNEAMRPILEKDWHKLGEWLDGHP